MSEAREEILAGVRRALAGADTSPVTVPRSYRETGPADPSTLLDLFVEHGADAASVLEYLETANLFLLPAAAYPDALSQLSGDMYASYQQNLRNSSLQVDTLVSDQIDCAISKMGVDACRDPNRNGVRLWALGGYNDSGVDGDGNGVGYGADGYFALLGVDYTTSNFTFGAFGGYRQSKAGFDRYDGRIDADGYQVGLLAGYDVGSFYIRGNGSYTSLNGDSSRSVRDSSCPLRSS